MVITFFKIIVSIKAYDFAEIIFLALNLIIGKFSLILKLYITKCVLQRKFAMIYVSKIETTHADEASS
jgi:hypothetical protein